MSKYKNAVLNKDGTVKSFTISCHGEDIHCSICGANCFHKPDKKDMSIYKCNTCDTKYKYGSNEK